MSTPSAGTQNTTLVTGDTVGDKYRVLRLLGKGGMGAVYLVEHKSLGNQFALKVLTGSSALHHARFGREARILASLRSEHVAKVVDFGFLDAIDSPYMVMEYLPGKDLAQVIEERSRPLAVRDAVDHVLEACEALVEAHREGIVHRDVKPSNIFLTTRLDGSPIVKVLDFGIAKAERATGDDTALTATTMVFGSPAYMSPEQVRSAKLVGPPTDIWSMALVLYELVSKTLPFHGDSTAGIVAAIAADPPTPLPPEVGPGLWSVLEPALRKDPSLRPPSLAAFAASLGRFGGERGRIVLARIERLTGQLGHTAVLSGQTREITGSVPPTKPSAPARADELPSSARTTVGAGERKTSRSSLVFVAAGALVVAFGVWVGMRSRTTTEPPTTQATSTMLPAAAAPSIVESARPESGSWVPVPASSASMPSPISSAVAADPSPSGPGRSNGNGKPRGGGAAPKSSSAAGPPRQGEFE